MPRILKASHLVRLRNAAEKAALAARAADLEVELLREVGSPGLSNYFRWLGCRDAGLDPRLPDPDPDEKNLPRDEDSA